MKQLTLIFALLLLASPLRAQTSNALPFTAVVPAAPVITSLGGLSPSGKIYTGSKLQIVGTGFSAGCNVNIDGAVQPGASVTFVSLTEIDYTVPAAMGSSVGTAHAVSVSCTLAPLTFNVAPKVTLPKGAVGLPYSADLSVLAQVTGGVTPYKFSAANGVLPAGLALSPAGVLAGVPTGSGSFSFSYTVTDSSGSALNNSVTGKKNR